MTIGDHLTEFMGKPVEQWHSGQSGYDFEKTVYRITLDYEEGEQGTKWTDKFAQFLSTRGSDQTEAFVVGFWNTGWREEPTIDEVIAALVSARRQLPRLKGIFLGDITYEENEISWIRQGDVSPLLNAYPALEYFAVRGSTGLVLGKISHPSLKWLVIQAGGLPGSVIESVIASDFPNLEHLELWLGTSGYGWDATIAIIKPLLKAGKFPKLRVLGLRDSEIADEVAHEVAKSDILTQIEVLDLSLGTLTDVGAEALLNAPDIRKLKKLDLHYNYCSEAKVEKLKQLPIEVDTADRRDPDMWNDEPHRYVAVGE